MVQNRIPRNFLFRQMVRPEGFSLPRNSLECNSEGFSLPRNGSDRNSEGFSLPRNCLERNSDFFLLQETGGIPMELPSVPSCSVFHGIISAGSLFTISASASR